MASYVYGNTVRKEGYRATNVVPKQSKDTSTRSHKKTLHSNHAYVLFLSIAAMLALAFCVNYLQLQSEVTNRSQNITSLQRELEHIREANMTKRNVLMHSMNLEEIREKAMNELGMVYATAEQIILYQDPTGNAVKQYMSIPESGIVPSSDIVE